MKKKVLIVAAALMLLLSTAVSASAITGYPMTYHPGTTDPVTNMPQNDNGMRGEAYNVSSTVPEREGYEFLGWELNHDSKFYTVTYVVKPDPVYGVPEDVTTPTDPSEYIAGDAVTVADQLISEQMTGINSKTGEERPGTWTFIPWNVEGFGETESFKINKDTTITGEWKFAISTYKYTVHHLDMDTYDMLAADEVFWLDELGQVVEKAKKKSEFYTQYQKSNPQPVPVDTYMTKRPDFLLPGAVYASDKRRQFTMTVTLTEDDQHIFFFYQRGGAG